MCWLNKLTKITRAFSKVNQMFWAKRTRQQYCRSRRHFSYARNNIYAYLSCIQNGNFDLYLGKSTENGQL